MRWLCALGLAKIGGNDFIRTNKQMRILTKVVEHIGDDNRPGIELKTVTTWYLFGYKLFKEL